jgi:hypothetical protein
VQYVVRPTLDFRGYAGHVASGLLRRGDAVAVLPSGRTSRVRSIVTFDGELDEAPANSAVTVTLEDEIDISRGDMLISPGAAPSLSRLFEAKVVWMHPGALEPGRSYLVKHTTQQVPATAVEILHKTDVNTLARLTAERLDLNEIGTVRFESRKPLFFDPYHSNRATGAFIVIDPMTNLTVGSGMITGAWVRERSNLRVTAAERERRYGHRGFSVALPGRLEVAHLLERELYDRGGVAVVVEQEELMAALAQSGLVAISAHSTADLVFDTLPDSDSAAVAEIVAALEARGLIRRERTGLDGDGI